MDGYPSVAPPPARETFEGVFQQPVEARRWLGSILDTHDLGAMTSDACLVLSELVTNSLIHGGGAPLVRAALDREGLRLEVTDATERLPEAHPQRTPDPSGGLGLVIVEQLCAGSGVEPFAGGKTVWATLRHRR
jgi:hypothetical protein